MSLTNRIKTEEYLISSDDIIGIKKLKDKNANFYGIEIIFRYGTNLRICNAKDALQIINIYDEPDESEN